MDEEERKPTTEIETEMELFCDDDTVCPICQAEFIDIEDMQTHILQVHQSKPADAQEPSADYQRHLCRFCNTGFASALEFALHLRDSHIVNIRTCMYCTRAFTSRQNLWKHEAKHSLGNSTMFSCSECPMIFTDLADLEYHELDSHNEGAGMMLQPYYPELSSVLCLHSDRFMNNAGKKTAYKCVCTYSTYDIMEYVKHVQTKICSCYVCNTCNNVYSEKRYIVRHVKTVCQRPKNTSLMKCPNCYKVVLRKDVKNHTRRCKAVKCFKCELSFDSLKELAIHKQEKHSNRSIILKECRYCAKSLVGLEMFKQHVEKKHIKTYLNYKYNCVYCEKIFDHPQRLFTHFGSTHRKIRPFVCNICDQTFLLRSKFTYHIKLNHESKGFVEFTKDLHVHFNPEKSPNPVTLTSPASLFTSAEEEELKKHGIELPVYKNSKNKKGPRLIGKTRPSVIKENLLNIDSSPAIEIEDTKDTEEKETDKEDSEKKEKTELTEIEASKDEDIPIKTEDNFESSDDEPIKNKKRKKGKYSKKLICNVCEQKCYTIENYNRHMESHKNNKDGLKQCLKCSKKFKTIANLKSHIQQQHSTSLVNTLRTMVEKRKQKLQTQQVPILRQAGFICNIEKVFIQPDYRPTANITPYNEGDTRPDKINNKGIDRALLKILSESRAAAKKRPLIVMKKCVFDETLEPPTKGIKIQQCETLDQTTTHYEPAKLQPYTGSVEKSKFIFTNAKSVGEEVYLEDDIITFDNEETQSDLVEYEQEIVTEKSVPNKPELFMLPSAENTEITEASTLLIPNEQTKQFGKINIATMFYTETGGVSYKIIPFDIKKDTAEEREEIEESEIFVGAPKLVQSNPLAHLMGSDKLMMPQESSTTKKYYKPKLSNPQLRIAKALMELKMPNKRKKQIRHRPPKGKHYKKSSRPENADAFRYEILDDEAENWAMVTED